MEPYVRDTAGDLSVALKPRVLPADRAFRIALIVLPLGVLGNIAYTLLATDSALLTSLAGLPRLYLLGALGLTLAPWATGTLRLFVWSRFLGHRLPIVELLRMTLVVDLGSAVTPTAFGGDAFRWGMLVRSGIRSGEAATLVLMPKLEDAVFFAVALPTAIILTAAWRLPIIAGSVRLLSGNVVTVFVAGAVIAAVAWVLARGALLGHAGSRVRRLGTRQWRRTRRWLYRTAHDARVAFAFIARGGRTRFAFTLTLTALHWIARYSVLSALALFLGVPFDPILFWLLQWVVFTMMSFVPTPGATGGAEIAFTAVYATLLPAGMIGVATAAWRMFTFYVPVGLAAVVFATLRTRHPISETTEGDMVPPRTEGDRSKREAQRVGR